MRFFSLFFLILLTGCFSEPPEPSIFKANYSGRLVNTATLSSDGVFALISNDKEICVWNNETRDKVYPCVSDSDAAFVELSGISANNQYFYLSNRLSVSLYRLADGKFINQWTTDPNVINDIAISRDGLVLILGYRNGETSTINVIKNTLKTYKLHELDVNSVGVSGDGKLAFTGSSDKKAILWETATGEVKFSLKHRSRVNHVDINEAGNLAISLDAIKDRFIWNVNDNEQQAELNTNLKFLEFNDTSFSKDGKYLLSGSPNRKIHLWNASTGELIQQWISHKEEGRDRASVLAVSINAGKVATISSDGVYEEFKLNKPL